MPFAGSSTLSSISYSENADVDQPNIEFFGKLGGKRLMR
jgi:hypothetical protein